jgi:hypothetical protein
MSWPPAAGAQTEEPGGPAAIESLPLLSWPRPSVLALAPWEGQNQVRVVGVLVGGGSGLAGLGQRGPLGVRATARSWPPYNPRLHLPAACRSAEDRSGRR